MAKQIKKYGKKALIFALIILLVGMYVMIPVWSSTVNLSVAVSCIKSPDDRIVFSMATNEPITLVKDNVTSDLLSASDIESR